MGVRRLTMFVAAFTLLIAGCVGQEDAGQEDPGQEAADQEDGAPPPESEEASQDTAAASDDGSIVRIAEPLSIKTMDPIADPGALHGTPVWSTVYETLVVVDLDGVVSPRLATEWEISDDATVFTFQLREGVTFHTGETLEAEDVVFSIERARDEGVPQNAARYGNVESVTALDELTVEVRLAEPEPLFLNTIGDPTGLVSAIVPRSAGERGDLSINAVGTGPLKLASYSPGVELILEPYDAYWDEGLEVGYEQLHVRFIEEDQSQIAALRSGEISVAKPTSAATVQGVEGDSDFEFAEYESNMFWLNFSNFGATEDLRVNQAVMLAIDRDAIVSGAFLSRATPASTVLPSHSYGLQPDELPNYTRDVDAARDLLAEAGYPDGIDLTFTFPTRNPTWTLMGEVLQASLAEAGITLELEPLEASVWLTRFLDQDYDLSMTDQTWYANPVRYVLPRPQWQSPPDEMVPALAELLSDFERTADEAEREQLFREIQTLEAESAYPFVGTVAAFGTAIYRPDLVSSVDASDLTRDVRRDYYLGLQPTG